MCQHDYKILLFHSLSGQTPFWIRGIGTFPGGPVGLFLTKTSPWRISNCNRMDRPVSTPIDSLQVIDISGIVAFDSAWTTPWNLFFAESGGTAQPAIPTGAPRFRTALRWLRRGLDLGPDSAACPAAQLGIRLSSLPGYEGARRRAEIPALHLRRHAAVATLQRNRAALGSLPPGPGQPDHQDRLPGRNRTGFSILIDPDQPFVSRGVDGGGRGAVDQPDQFFSGAAAALHADGRTFRRGHGLDRRQPARLPTGYGAGAQRDSDFLVLGHADLHRGREVSTAGEVSAARQPALLRGTFLSRHSAALQPAAIGRPGDLGGVWNRGVCGGRSVLPLYEARFRRRSLRVRGCRLGDVRIRGRDLGVALAGDSRDRLAADGGYSRRNEYDEGQQERVLDQVLTIVLQPQSP